MSGETKTAEIEEETKDIVKKEEDKNYIYMYCTYCSYIERCLIVQLFALNILGDALRILLDIQSMFCIPLSVFYLCEYSFLMVVPEQRGQEHRNCFPLSKMFLL